MSSSTLGPHGYSRAGCGYCGSRKAGGGTSRSYYANSSTLLPEHYQALADRGWRRSGTTYYKPDLRNSCCPHYTIRLDAAAFQPTQKQRKAVNALNDHLTGQQYKNAVARLAPRSREEKRFRRHNWHVDTVVHEAEYTRLAKPIDPRSGLAVEPAHALHVTLEPDDFTEEKFALFENYQRIVHHDSSSRPGFRRFLCSGFPQTRESPPGSPPASSSPPAADDSAEAKKGSGKRLGSYHQCYRLDGQLVALGVLDLLPHAVSSVYLVYHESVAHWNLGKVSALQEIALTREHGYQYYYMGYYIHSCVKMKYKLDFRPQYVLDPIDYRWHSADQDLRDSLDGTKLVNFTDGRWRPEHKLSATPEESDQGQRNSGNSDDQDIWAVDMPGVMSVNQIVQHVSTDSIHFRTSRGLVPLSAVIGDEWETDEMRSGASIQSVAAEWVACVGPDLYDKIAIQGD